MTTIKYHTKEETLQAVNENGGNLEFCSKELQNDEEVVMTAIKKNSWNFKYASNELKSSKHFIMKALNEGVYPDYLIEHSTIAIQSDIETVTLALEKSNDGIELSYAQGEAALNKELAAKALVKWGNCRGTDNFTLWAGLHPTLQELFPTNCWYKKAKTYLYQLEQEKQAEMVLGGCSEEDGVVW